MVEPAGEASGGLPEGGSAGRETPEEVEELLDGVPDPWGVPSVVHLRARGTSLLLAVGVPGLPRVLHWGADLGELTVDETDALAAALPGEDAGAPLLALPPARPGAGGPGAGSPAAGEGPCPSVPGLGLRPAGTAPSLVRERTSLSVTADGRQRLQVRARDAGRRLLVEVSLSLDPAGVLSLRGQARVEPPAPCRLGGLHLALPVPAAGRQVLVDVGGRLRHPVSRPARAAPGGHVRPGEAVGAVVAATAGGAPEELWALAATTGSRRSEARRAADPLVRAVRSDGGTALVGGEDVAEGDGESSWTTPLLVAAHGRSWPDLRARLAAAGRSGTA
ncbi:hypothetical protein [Pseudokineococcus sp. 1T1Z-3]|uniref:hypothetical protein n=1 Tax=Pseudokineococcus sp. 1T1Z-3 TaxID=3132745 RepID=UPI0030B3CA7E